MHNIREPYEKFLARSEDGGETWSIEWPNVSFEGEVALGTAPEISLCSNLDGWPPQIFRVCGVYDTGGEHADPHGSYYRSDGPRMGSSWEGPFAFTGLELPEGQILTGRTRVLQDPMFPTRPDLWFMTKGLDQMFGTDDCFVMRRSKDGVFEHVGVVCDDEYRAACPAVARVGDRIVCVLRRKGTGRKDGWVDAFASDDEGETWHKLGPVGVTGGHNGNPPALVATGDRLVCCFANRNDGTMRIAESADAGETWQEQIFRDGGLHDIGYPQLFVRSDGVPVCVYYWSDGSSPQHIVATTFDDRFLKRHRCRCAE